MNWLLHHYFIPNLTQNTQPADADEVAQSLSPLQPLLKRYKVLHKQIAKDRSLQTRLNPDAVKILRDVERWIGEAKLAATTAVFDGWGFETSSSNEDGSRDGVQLGREKYALDILCENLLERGCLVPVSSR